MVLSELCSTERGWGAPLWEQGGRQASQNLMLGVTGSREGTFWRRAKTWRVLSEGARIAAAQ